MHIVCCLLLLLAHCAEHSWSSGIVGSHSAICRRSSREKGDDTYRYASLGLYVKRYEKKLTPGEADRCDIRTAGSDKHNEPQQYCAYGCVAHARRVGGSVGTMGSICDCLLRTWCEENRHIHLDNNLPIRTYKIRPLVLKPGKSSYPLPPVNKKSGACHALQRARIAPGLRPTCPAGLPVSTS